MGRFKKKIFTFLFLFAFILTFLPAYAFGAEDKEGWDVIYVQPPENWSGPCIWAWDEAGNNAFEAWPGGEMTADAGNAGWYYLFVPDWANHVIVNGEEGNVQTEELVRDAGNAWITITADNAATVSDEPLTQGDIPEYEETFEIHAKVDASWETPHLWAWSAPDGTNAFEAWPGVEMKQEENGWYSAKAPVWVNSLIVNNGEEGVQTEDISVDPAELWITVAADGSFDFSYTDPEKEEVPNVTVRVRTPDDWETPCLWAWSAPDGTNVYTTWPGEALEEEDGGWLKKEIPGWVNSIIVNANDGAIQTTDIAVDTAKDVWITVNGPEDFTVAYEEPAAVDMTEEASTQEVEAQQQEHAPAWQKAVVPVIVVVIAAAAIIIFVAVKKKEKTK